MVASSVDCFIWSIVAEAASQGGTSEDLRDVLLS
jgi:hypothetical protein